MFQDLGKRFFISAGSSVVVGALLFFSTYSAFRPLFALAVAGIGALCAIEYSKIARLLRMLVNKKILVIGTFIEIYAFFIYSQKKEYFFLPFVVFFFLLIVFFFLRRKNIEGSFSYVAASSFSLLYIAIPLGFLFPLLYFFEDGRMWLLYVIVVTKITDIGAYFGGRFLGKRSFFKDVSPKKTKEGALIGLLLAIGTSFLFFRSIESIFLGALLGVVGQFGDLFESLFKRDAKIKDSSTLPGFGGFLDMLDSLIFNIPLVYFYLEVWK